MKQYPAYPAYKTTGCDWFPEIPSHWGIDRAKWSISSCQNGVWGAEPDGDDDLVCIRVADFDRQSLRVSTEKLTMRSIAEKDRRNRLLKNGDLLLEKSGGGEQQLVGAVVEFNQPFPAVTSNFIARMVASDGMNSRFLVYLHSHLYSGRVNFRSIKQTTGIQNLDSQAYLDESITYPPLDEQQAIAGFLDFRTAQIDALIAKKKALLDKLAEKRTALISHAVTKGLDPSVPMKDSKAAWLGDIPRHWEAKRLKFVISEPLKYGANEAAELTDPELPRYIRITDVNDDGSLREETFRSLSDEVADGYLLSDGDILLARSGATVGKSFIYKPSWGVAAYAGYLIRARMSEAVNADFAYLFLQSSCYWQWLSSVFIQATIQNVSAEKYANLVIPVPPVKEQLSIVTHLLTQLKRIDAQRERANLAVERLIEYRSALITNAVTGKIDVRDFDSADPRRGG